jgi:hypothetical protein
MATTKKYYLSAIIIAGSVLCSTYALADCTYPTLASNVTEGIDLYNAGLQATPAPTKNTTVCVDVPVQLFANKMVFNIDSPVTSDGTANGTPTALKHMWMMGAANVARVKGVTKHGGTISIADFHIKGIIHGSALSWALNDEWWQSQVDKDGNQLYPGGNPNKEWINKVLGLQSKGLDIQLEVCAVTLMGKNLSNTDVYPGILVNQGAFGRMSALHQDGYAIVSEGWVDNDRRHRSKDSD